MRNLFWPDLMVIFLEHTAVHVILAIQHLSQEALHVAPYVHLVPAMPLKTIACDIVFILGFADAKHFVAASIANMRWT